MSDYRLIALGVLTLLIIGYVRMLERPDEADDVMGELFRADSVRIDPVLAAACAAVRLPLEEVYGTALERTVIGDSRSEHHACRLSGRVAWDASSTARVQTRRLFEAMGWTRLTSPTLPDTALIFRREPVACRYIDVAARPDIEAIAVQDSVDVSLLCEMMPLATPVAED